LRNLPTKYARPKLFGLPSIDSYLLTCHSTTFLAPNSN